MLVDREEVSIWVGERRGDTPGVFLRLSLLEFHTPGLQFRKDLLAVADAKDDWGVVPWPPVGRPTVGVFGPCLEESEFQVLPLGPDGDPPVAARRGVIR